MGGRRMVWVYLISSDVYEWRAEAVDGLWCCSELFGVDYRGSRWLFELVVG